MKAPTRTVVRWAALLTSFVYVIAGAQPAGGDRDGENFRIDLELGVEYSDNRGRSNPPGPDDTLLIPRIFLDVGRSGARWAVVAEGFAEHRHSLDNEFEDEWRARLAARLDWKIRPESLDWTLVNVASVEPISLVLADAPDNLQQVNVFATGPNWTIRPGAAWSALIDARFIDSYAEETDAFNSERWTASGRLLRRLAPNRRVSLGLEYGDVRFGNPDFSGVDFERFDAVVRLQSDQARTEVDVAAGYTRIEPETLPELSSVLFRLLLARQVGDAASLRLTASHELSDSVRQLATSIDAPEFPVSYSSRLPIGSALYELTQIELGWTHRTPRLDWSVTPYWREYDFEFDIERDFREVGGRAGFSWRMQPLTSLQVQAELDRRRFNVERRRDSDWYASVFIVRSLAPRWSARVGFSRYERDSSVPGEDSRENIAAVFLTFHAGR